MTPEPARSASQLGSWEDWGRQMAGFLRRSNHKDRSPALTAFWLVVSRGSTDDRCYQQSPVRTGRQYHDRRTQRRRGHANSRRNTTCRTVPRNRGAYPSRGFGNGPSTGSDVASGRSKYWFANGRTCSCAKFSSATFGNAKSSCRTCGAGVAVPEREALLRLMRAKKISQPISGCSQPLCRCCRNVTQFGAV